MDRAKMQKDWLEKQKDENKIERITGLNDRVNEKQQI